MCIQSVRIIAVYLVEPIPHNPVFTTNIPTIVDGLSGIPIKKIRTTKTLVMALDSSTENVLYMWGGFTSPYAVFPLPNQNSGNIILSPTPFFTGIGELADKKISDFQPYTSGVLVLLDNGILMGYGKGGIIANNFERDCPLNTVIVNNDADRVKFIAHGKPEFSAFAIFNSITPQQKSVLVTPCSYNWTYSGPKDNLYLKNNSWRQTMAVSGDKRIFILGNNGAGIVSSVDRKTWSTFKLTDLSNGPTPVSIVEYATYSKVLGRIIGVSSNDDRFLLGPIDSSNIWSIHTPVLGQSSKNYVTALDAYDRLFIIGKQGQIAYGADPNSLLSAEIKNLDGNVVSAVYGDQLVVLTDRGSIFKSPGIFNSRLKILMGLTFNISNSLAVNWKSIAYGNGIYIAVGDNTVAYSKDAQTWNISTTPFQMSSYVSVAYTNGNFLILGDNGPSLYTSDGKTFQETFILNQTGILTKVVAVTDLLGNNAAFVISPASGLILPYSACDANNNSWPPQDPATEPDLTCFNGWPKNGSVSISCYRNFNILTNNSANVIGEGTENTLYNASFIRLKIPGNLYDTCTLSISKKGLNTITGSNNIDFIVGDILSISGFTIPNSATPLNVNGNYKIIAIDYTNTKQMALACLGSVPSPTPSPTPSPSPAPTPTPTPVPTPPPTPIYVDSGLIDGGTIKPSVNLESYGSAVAISEDGSTLVVGAPDASINYDGNLISTCGAVYVYKNSNNSWVFVNKIYNTSPIARERFGRSVAISLDGSVIVVGAIGYNTIGGSTYIIEAAAGSWSLAGKIAPTDEMQDGDWGFKTCCSSDGNVIVTSSPSWTDPTSGSPNAGAVSVFRRQQKTTPWANSGVFKLDTNATDYRFGYSIAIDATGDTLVVGNERSKLAPTNEGFASVYRYDGLTYALFQKISNATYNGTFGHCVAISGDGARIVVATNASNGNESYVGIYDLIGSSYELIQAAPSNLSKTPYETVQISRSGSTILLGASTYKSNGGITNSGAVFTCTNPDGVFKLDEIFVSPTAAQNDNLPGIDTGATYSEALKLLLAPIPLRGLVQSFKANKGVQSFYVSTISNQATNVGTGAACSVSSDGSYAIVASFDSPYDKQLSDKLTNNIISANPQAFSIQLLQRSGRRFYEDRGLLINTAIKWPILPDQSGESVLLPGVLKYIIPPAIAHDDTMTTFIVGTFKNNSIIIADKADALNGIYATPELSQSQSGIGRGASVGMSGDGLTAIVGCIYGSGISSAGYLVDRVGSIEIYERDALGLPWRFVTWFRPIDVFLSASNGFVSPQFGYSCSIYGTTGNRIIAAGAPKAYDNHGAIYLYNYDNRSAGTNTIITIDGSTIDSGTTGLGTSLKLYYDITSASYVLAAGTSDGKVYIFRGPTYDTLTMQGTLVLPAAAGTTSDFGRSIGITSDSKKMLIVSAPKAKLTDNSNPVGCIFKYPTQVFGSPESYSLDKPQTDAYTGFQIISPITSEGSTDLTYTNIAFVNAPNYDNRRGIVNIFFKE